MELKFFLKKSYDFPARPVSNGSIRRKVIKRSYGSLFLADPVLISKLLRIGRNWPEVRFPHQKGNFSRLNPWIIFFSFMSYFILVRKTIIYRLKANTHSSIDLWAIYVSPPNTWSMCLPVRLCLSISVCPSLSLSISQFFHLSVCPYLRQSVSVSPSIRFGPTVSVNLSRSVNLIPPACFGPSPPPSPPSLPTPTRGLDWRPISPFSDHVFDDGGESARRLERGNRRQNSRFYRKSNATYLQKVQTIQGS